MGHQAIAALPAIPAESRKRSMSDLFAPAFIATTTIVTLAYFFHITTFYFIVKWIPKIVADLGFDDSSAAGVLVWTNVGGALGGAVLGILTQRYRVKTLTVGLLWLSTVMVTWFGRTRADLQWLSLVCAAAGFCTNAGIIGLYAIVAQAFPTHIRASGTGFTIGVGRGGSVLAPIVAGFLFAAGYPLSTVAMAMAVGSLLAGAMLLLLRLETDRPSTEREDRPAVSHPLSPAARNRSR
jgi:MFS family permease